MHPVHDIDALLLLAITISSKRRPAELVEIIAANDLIHGSISSKSELSVAFERLSLCGLIARSGDGYVLTPQAVSIMSDGRKKADNEERLIRIKENLSDYHPKGEHAAIVVSSEQLSLAVQAHQVSKAHAGKNLLVPKPKPVVDSKRPQRRKPLPSRRKF